MSRRLNDPALSSNTSLTFGETRVTGSDIRILSNNGWINDTLVAFYFEYLNSRVFTSYKCSLCVPPDVTGLIQITPANEIGVFLEPLGEERKDLLLFSLNNTTPEEHAHWSLLVYSKWDNKVFHFDSQSGHNAAAAVDFGAKLMSYFSFTGQVVEETCLQQKNPQDSGLFMLANAEQTIMYAAKARTVEGCPRITEKIVNEYRNKMLKLIWKLKHSSSVYQIRSSNKEVSLFSKSWHDEHHGRDHF